MKLNLITSFFFLIAFGSLLSSCDDIIEPSINKSQIQLEAPADQYVSTSYAVNFWWDAVNHALTYHLQVVTPSFASPGKLVLDTVISKTIFYFTLNPGQYQWRVMAENGSSQTLFTAPRSFTVAATSIKQQSVQLNVPVNNYLTNKNIATFQWSNLYGATQYRFEIDTNNFVNESAVISNQVVPGQQLNFTFPKDQVYQWRVRAENDTAQAQWSAINIITYDHTPPGQATVSAPANGTTVGKPVLLQWGTVATASKYKLYVFKADSTTLYSNSFPLTVNGNSYGFNQGSSGDKVYWQVTALDAAGNESVASQMRNFILQ